MAKGRHAGPITIWDGSDESTMITVSVSKATIPLVDVEISAPGLEAAFVLDPYQLSLLIDVMQQTAAKLKEGINDG